jgi:DNA polymerase III delta prime subunit
MSIAKGKTEGIFPPQGLSVPPTESSSQTCPKATTNRSDSLSSGPGANQNRPDQLDEINPSDSEDELMKNLMAKRQQQAAKNPELFVPKDQPKTAPKGSAKRPTAFFFSNCNPVMPLLNKQIALKGCLSVFDDWGLFKAVLESLGATVVTDHLTKNTNLLIHGLTEGTADFLTTSTFKTAIDQGIPAISDRDFEVRFYDKFGHKVQSLADRISTLPLDNTTVDLDNRRLWVDVFQPNSSADIVGNTQQVNELKRFLQNWASDSTTKAAYRAVLISGPPGIGKTTAAKLCAKESRRRFVVQNASDSRNKSDVQGSVGVVKNNKVLSRHFANETEDVVLIMDEVDGMSGDKGGMAELIDQIKTTRNPIVCVCNDASSSKVKSLLSHCKSLEFKSPSEEEVAARLGDILAKINLSHDVKQRLNPRMIAHQSRGDIRQAISCLQFECFSGSNIALLGSSLDHDTRLSASEACRAIAEESASQPLKRLLRLFFCDFNLVPVFAFESYLGLPWTGNSRYANSRHANRLADLEKADVAITSMMKGESMHKQLAESNDYSILPNYGLHSTVLPLTVMKPTPPRLSSFPVMFMKQSARSKRKRLFRELKDCAAAIGDNVTDQCVLTFAVVIVKLMTAKFAEIKKGRSESEVFGELFVFCHEMQLTESILKDNLKEVLRGSLDEGTSAEFDQFLQGRFLESMREQFGKDGFVCVSKGKKNKGKEGQENNSQPHNKEEEREEEQENLTIDF